MSVFLLPEATAYAMDDSRLVCGLVKDLCAAIPAGVTIHLDPAAVVALLSLLEAQLPPTHTLQWQGEEKT